MGFQFRRCSYPAISSSNCTIAVNTPIANWIYRKRIKLIWSTNATRSTRMGYAHYLCPLALLVPLAPLAPLAAALNFWILALVRFTTFSGSQTERTLASATVAAAHLAKLGRPFSPFFTDAGRRPASDKAKMRRRNGATLTCYSSAIADDMAVDMTMYSPLPE
jgi:hypothetical protein